jgi:Domain of unknown function (DUF4388)
MSLAGRLEDIALADIFQILSIGRKTGILTIRGSKGTALIVFKNGMIVRAETDDLAKNLAENLRAAGLIKDTVFHLAAEVKKKLPSKSLAEILFDLGSVNRNILEQVTRKRIERVIGCLLLWEDGDFQFEPDDLKIEDKTSLADLGWELGKGLSPEYLLMEGARVQDESTQASFVPTEEFSLEGPVAGEEEGGWEEDWETPRVERKDISALKALTQELRVPNSTSEITLLILRFASDIFQRGVLFMAGRNEIVGLGQFGLEIERADEKIRATVLNLEKSGFLKKVVAEQMTYKGLIEKDEVTSSLINGLGGDWPPEAALFPVIAEGKVVALLYADNVPTDAAIPETEGLEIFISQAGLALEKSLLQRRLQEMEKERGSL